MQEKNWELRVGHWRTFLEDITVDDFVYFDPTYIGKHTDYYQQWLEKDTMELAEVIKQLTCGFALSMWKKDKYRKNKYFSLYQKGLVERTFTHFYHVRPTENLRQTVKEALLIKAGYKTSLAKTDLSPMNLSNSQI